MVENPVAVGVCKRFSVMFGTEKKLPRSELSVVGFRLCVKRARFESAYFSCFCLHNMFYTIHDNIYYLRMQVKIDFLRD